EYGAVLHGPSAGAGHHGLGSVAGARGDWTLAATQYEAAAHEQPTNTRYLADLPQAYAELGRHHDAEFTLKKAQELSPRTDANTTRLSASIEKTAPADVEHDP